MTTSIDRKLGLLQDDHLECRSFRYHALERRLLAKTKTGDVLRVSVCTRCGAVRTDRYTRRGVLMSRRYDMPSGYGIDARPLSEDVMRELIRRAALVTASDDDARALARSLMQEDDG